MDKIGVGYRNEKNDDEEVGDGKEKRLRNQMESEGGGVHKGLHLAGIPPPDFLQEGSGETPPAAKCHYAQAQTSNASGDDRMSVNEKWVWNQIRILEMMLKVEKCMYNANQESSENAPTVGRNDSGFKIGGTPLGWNQNQSYKHKNLFYH